MTRGDYTRERFNRIRQIPANASRRRNSAFGLPVPAWGCGDGHEAAGTGGGCWILTIRPPFRRGGNGGGPHQPHPGTRVRRCRCSLPGLTGFTTLRCEGTDADRHRPDAARRQPLPPRATARVPRVRWNRRRQSCPMRHEPERQERIPREVGLAAVQAPRQPIGQVRFVPATERCAGACRR